MDWLQKRHRSSGESFGEVYISKVCLKTSPATSFRLKNEVVNKITKTGYVKIAFKGTRMYFDEAESYEGWKLCSAGVSGQFFKIKDVSLPINLEIGLGNYNVEFDTMLGYYYVDFDKQLDKKAMLWRTR